MPETTDETIVHFPAAGEDPLLADEEWDEETNRPKFANFCIKMIEQEKRDWERLLSQVYEIVDGWNEPENQDSPWAKDWALSQESEFMQGQMGTAVKQFQLLMNSASDYAESMLHMLQGDRLRIQPMWSLSRGFMEAVLLTCWLIDSTKTPEMRMARACSLLPSIFQGAIDALIKFPGSAEEYKEKIDGRAKLIDYYERNKVDLLYRKDKQGNSTEHLAAVVFKGNKAAFSRNVTQLAEWYLPEDGHLYPLLSGASHSEFWLINGLETNGVGQALNSVVMPVFPVSAGYTRAVTQYFGIEPSYYANRNSRRLTALLMRGGGAKKEPETSTSFGLRSRGLPHEFTKRSGS